VTRAATKQHQLWYMRRFLRQNSLSLVPFVLFLGALAGQALTGWRVEVQDLVEHGRSAETLGAYLDSGAFVSATFENWESEFLQMALFLILGTVLRQRGSAESRPLDPSEEPPGAPLGPDSPWPARRGGLARDLYRYSLSIAFLLLFLVSFGLHATGSLATFNEEAREHHAAVHTLVEHLGSARLWFESFQNWQSEFLSVLAMVVLSIWLRQDGSPESKHINEPHRKTGS
jgi:hypothetical protein